MDDPKYKTTQEDIAIMIRHLRRVAPEHATPEKANYILEQNKIHIESLEQLYPEVIESMLKDFESR